MLRADRPLVSRVREIRMHGLNGGLALLSTFWLDRGQHLSMDVDAQGAMAPGAVSTRLFVALWPGEPVRQTLAQHQQQWRWPRGSSPVRREKLHMTLHFLGQVPRERLPELAGELVVSVEPFELQLDRDELWHGGIAVLSPAAIPEALKVLHAALHDVLRRLQLNPAREGLRPHVTLARRAAHAQRPAPGAAIVWPVQGYVLVESEPAPSSGYRVLRAYE